MTTRLETDLRAFGVSPQVGGYVAICQILAQIGSSAVGTISAYTGDAGVIQAAEWLDFALGVRNVPPGLDQEILEVLANICQDTTWMENPDVGTGTQIAQGMTPLLSLIPGVGSAANTAANIVFAIWSFARAFRNKMCSTPEIRAIVIARPEGLAALIAAAPPSLLRDHEASLQRRLDVERVLEQYQGRRARTDAERTQLATAKADDNASSAQLLLTERLLLRYAPIGPMLGTPATTVARFYIKRPPGYLPPGPDEIRGCIPRPATREGLTRQPARGNTLRNVLLVGAAVATVSLLAK